jgi:hypothetical protein
MTAELHHHWGHDLPCGDWHPQDRPDARLHRQRRLTSGSFPQSSREPVLTRPRPILDVRLLELEPHKNAPELHRGHRNRYLLHSDEPERGIVSRGVKARIALKPCQPRAERVLSASFDYRRGDPRPAQSGCVAKWRMLPRPAVVSSLLGRSIVQPPQPTAFFSAVPARSAGLALVMKGSAFASTSHRSRPSLRPDRTQQAARRRVGRLR